MDALSRQVPGTRLRAGAVQALLTTAGMLAQAIRGYHDFEPGLYLKILFGLQLPEYLLFALLALVVHVAVNQKYIGHLVAILVYVVIVLAPMFGLEHNLLIYGAGPAWSYTEMRGFGPSIGPWAWFKLYWAGWALLLAVVARLLWVRGRENGFARESRWRAVVIPVPRRGPPHWQSGSSSGWADSSSTTRMCATSTTASDIVQRGAEYERLYGRYARVPQPALAAAILRVEIHPGRRAADIRGSYRLVNHDDVAIDSIHVATALDVETGDVSSTDPPSWSPTQGSVTGSTRWRPHFNPATRCGSTSR